MAKPKMINCSKCKVKTLRDDMVLHVHEASTGTKKNMYFHEDCLKEYLKDKELKDSEAKELDELYEVIKKLHNLEVIPGNFFSLYIQPLRNGVFKSGNRVKKYKQGIPFSTMKDSYLYISKSVEHARKNKEFDGSIGFLRYTFAIMVDKMPMAKKNKKQKDFAKVIEDQNRNIKQSKDDILFAEREVKFKKKTNGGVDLSEFLD